MKILVTGGKGLVGSHFVENYQTNILAPTSKDLDITDPNSVNNFFKLYNPDVVIHFAAYTDVSVAETERDNKKGLCWTINVVGTENLVKAATNAYFINISTDVVFSGSKENKGPYTEDHPTEENSALLSWYGWTKREAEKVVTTNLKNSATVRISNPVRADYSEKTDYVQKIINAYDANKLNPMFDDQYLTLTYINEVTDTLKKLLEKRPTGIFHVSSTNVFTPFKLSNYLIEKARKVRNAVKPISIEEFLKKNSSRYPQYGGLKVKETEKRLNMRYRTWEEVIEILAKQFSV